MAKKKPKMWMYVSPKPPKISPSAEAKAEVQRKADELIETILKPRHVKRPPKKPRFNYIIEISSKWHGPYFYFVSTYASPSPTAISPTFESRFARLQYVGGKRFNLAFMRYTGRWIEVLSGRTLDECLMSIQDGGWFEP